MQTKWTQSYSMQMTYFSSSILLDGSITVNLLATSAERQRGKTVDKSQAEYVVRLTSPPVISVMSH